MAEKDPLDPKGLIREAYLIEGISAAECRSIFLDWALSHRGDDHTPAIEKLLTQYGPGKLDHPMTHTLTAALADASPAKRRGGRAARLTR
jgi:hypothetical protein